MGMSDADSCAHLQILSQSEYRILKTIVRQILPGASEIQGLDLAQRIDSALAPASRKFGQDLKRLLFVFEYGAPLLGFTLKQFTQMSPEEKDRYLSGWERSHLSFKRMGFQALKRLALAAFYGSDESWNVIGYQGPWLNKGYPYDYQGKGIKTFPRN